MIYFLIANQSHKMSKKRKMIKSARFINNEKFISGIKKMQKCYNLAVSQILIFENFTF